MSVRVCVWELYSKVVAWGEVHVISLLQYQIRVCGVNSHLPSPTTDLHTHIQETAQLIKGEQGRKSLLSDAGLINDRIADMQ